MRVTSQIWRAAGSPPMDRWAAGICRTCGDDSTGMAFGEWVRDTFTDLDKITGGAIVCEACQFCFADRNEALTRMTGKPKLQRMRNYSHFVVDGVWSPVSKGDKRKMLSLLMLQPAVAVIAESGQKHIIFRSRIGWWQFEEECLRPFPEELGGIIAVVERLYSGFSKGQIETGRYEQHLILKFGVLEWANLEPQIEPLRGTAKLRLALFLAQKEEADIDEPGDS